MKTYSRKRDRGGLNKSTSSDALTSDSVTDSPSSSQSSIVSETPSPPSSQSSQPSTQPSSSSQSTSSSSSSSPQTLASPPQTLSSSPPSTPTKKTKLEWWKIKPTSEDKKKKSTPTKKTSTPKKDSTPKKKEQMFLDLGQKNFDAKLCPECGMMYAPGVQEDAIMHTKFHTKHENIINFPQWKSCKVIKEYPLGGAVICVGKDDTNANQKKVSKVRKMMDKELGYVDAGNPDIEPNQKIYLYISTKNKVVGCIVAEEIDEAFPVIIKDHKPKQATPNKSTSIASSISSTPPKFSPAPSTPKKSKQPADPTETTDEFDLDKLIEETDEHYKAPTKSTHKETAKSEEPVKSQTDKQQNGTPSKKNGKVEEAFLKNFSVSCSKEPQKAVCGISRIWTARSHRRQGIATRLLDAVRTSMIYGYTIPRELCAFSQPTADGKLFFESYRGTKEFLVYL